MNKRPGAVVAAASLLIAGAGERASAADPPALSRARSVTWAFESESPIAIAPRALSDREADLLAHCGVGEGGLRDVAQRVLDRKLHGLPYLDLDGLSFGQRASGEPHVWPRAWIVSGRALDHDSTLRKLDAWRATSRDLGERRCGVAAGVNEAGTEVVVAIAVDALADLAPLKVRARAGEWLTVEARMLVPTTGASVVILGPSGAPRTVPTSFAKGLVRAKFAPDRPGAFTVQIVADVETGPRPVLEASVFAEVEPPPEMLEVAAPGEDQGASVRDEVLALTRMVEATRQSEGLRPIARDAALDALARAHALRMAHARTLGHDVGDGDPSLRMRDAGLAPRDAGENVAHSPTVVLAHRALYASPSHRANLLRAGFDRMGIAVIDDADGSVWVDEVFASGM